MLICSLVDQCDNAICQKKDLFLPSSKLKLQYIFFLLVYNWVIPMPRKTHPIYLYWEREDKISHFYSRDKTAEWECYQVENHNDKLITTN